MYRKTVLAAVAVSFALVVSLSVALATTFDDTPFTSPGHLEHAGNAHLLLLPAKQHGVTIPKEGGRHSIMPG